MPKYLMEMTFDLDLDRLAVVTQYAVNNIHAQGGTGRFTDSPNPIQLEITGLTEEQLDKLENGVSMQAKVLGGQVLLNTREVEP